ncbi:MAG TPA: phosphomannose isomerase type II C-terminal cupin domain [Deltaproteobacteria bacterium]|nr:phosphomannose isomerase type II C-terminal cupin domain [Deltaproteobacteria bacterium]HPL88429.1 phosphomannose isomerase type II C-terminal cupin domain [Deltaproteobacteria bacterium]HQO81964.1 phosphomannose isomerase type II C-terminal cupin domain [Deltaproteobacteria bacterium]
MGMQVGILLEETSLHNDLVEGLTSAGIGVDVHVISPVLSGARALEQAGSFLNRAAGCDIVHNLCGCFGLLLAPLSPVPVVWSVPATLTEDEAAVYRAVPGRCFFVSEEARELPGLRKVPGLGLFDGDRVRYYLDVYSRVLAMGKSKEHRPWGNYEILSEDRDDHKVKRITVLPGKRLSLQYHGRRKEHWIVISGRALATVGDETAKVGPSGTVDIPHGASHRIENIGSEDLIFIEVQQGDYFGEDDIVRIEDDFGRI